MSLATGAITITDLNDGLNYDIELSAPVIYKDAINAATTGTYTSITATGKQILGATKTTFGFLTVQLNGGTETTPVANVATIAPATTSKASYYTVNLYANAAKTGGLLATVDVPVVFKGEPGVPGTPAKVISLSPSALVFKVPETGATTPSTITVTGTQQGTTISSWSYSINGGTYSTTLPAGVTRSGSIVTITASTMTANSISVKASDGTVDDIVTISKVADGNTGAPAKVLDLNATAEVMSFNADGTPTIAQTVSFTANLENLTGTAVFTATPYNAAGTALTAVTLGGTGNTRTLTSAQWPSTAVRVAVTATLSGYTDTVTIIQVKDGGKGADGKDPIVGFLTNESVTLSASSTGVVSSFSTATGTFEVYEGLLRRTGAAPTYVKTANVGCTAAITTLGVYSVSAMTADVASATFTATLNGVTLTKTLSLAKSREGGSGTPGAPGSPGAPGTPGAPGAPGQDALSVMILNENQSIAVTSSRAASVAQVIDIPFVAFLGTTQIPATITYGTLPTGVTLTSNTPSTATVPGSLKFAVALSANLGGTTTAFDSGRIDLTVTANGVSVTQPFNWSKTVAGAAGATARVYYVSPSVPFIVKSPATNLYTPTGITFSSYYTNGTSAVQTAYAAFWRIETTTDGSTWTQFATQTTASATYTVAAIPPNIKGIRATSYTTSALTPAVSADTQSAMVVMEGEKGEPGLPGQTTYTWVKYADSITGTGIADSPTGKRFIGFAHNKTTLTESTTPSHYEWSPLYDNVIVGARNLLLASNVYTENGSYLISNYDLTQPIAEGETVTLTIRGTLAATKTNFSIYNSGGSVTMGSIPLKEPGVYQKTFNWVVGASSNTFLSVYAMSNAQVGTSIIESIKLERGNVGTDYSKAPEDISAEAANIANLAQEAAEAYASAQAELTIATAEAYADGRITEEETARIEDAAAKLAEAKAYAEKMAAEAAAGIDLSGFATNEIVENLEIRMKKEISGTTGLNALRNSIGYAGIDYWEHTVADNQVVTSIMNERLRTLGYGSGFYFPVSGTSFKGIQQTVNVTPGQPYTLSWFVNRATPGAFEVSIYEGEILKQTLVDTSEIDGEFSTQYFVYIPESNQLTIRFTAAGPTEALLTGIMLGLGTMPTQWTLANGELYNAYVRIDDNGLVVIRVDQNGDIEGFTNMTPEEFAGYYDENRDGTYERIFWFNKDETVTKKLKALDEITMGTIKVIRIESTQNRGWAFVPIVPED